MAAVMHKCLSRLVEGGIAGEEPLILGTVDAEVTWSTPPEDAEQLSLVFDRLNASALLFGKPREPYRSIVSFLAQEALDSGSAAVTPRDSETRTFLHRLPVADALTPTSLFAQLQGARAAIFADGSVAAQGSVSADEAAVNFSSACFSAYVKFMTDCLEKSRNGRLSVKEKQVLDVAMQWIERLPEKAPIEPAGPFSSERDVLAAIGHVGKTVVQYRLVDSAFGNVSFLYGDTLYISETGAALDCLEGQIDACPLDDSRSTGITASSELPAHREIYTRTAWRGVLHGHPRFAVIMSLFCEREDCADKARCHTGCREERSVGGVPVVCGEVGSGPFGLCNTVPQALTRSEAVIVLGHGLFVGAARDFQEALKAMFKVENACIEEFVKRITRSAE